MGTAVELTADIQTLLTMPKEQRIAIGMEDRGIVERDFSLNAMVRNCETVYQLALQPKRRVVVSGYYGYENLGMKPSSAPFAVAIESNMTWLCCPSTPFVGKEIWQ